MNKELQDRAWAALPKETRKQIRQDYLCGLYNIKNLLMDLFGLHNLTSDTEPEEVLCVERSKVQEMYAAQDEIIRWSNDGPKGYRNRIEAEAVKLTLYEFFDKKCIPDKTDVGFSYRKDFDDGSFFEAKNGEFTIVAKNTPNLSNSQKIGKDAEKKSEPADTQNPFKVGDFVVFKHCINVFMITDIRGENVVVDGKTMYAYWLFDKVDTEPKFKPLDRVCLKDERNVVRVVQSVNYDSRFLYYVNGFSQAIEEDRLVPYLPEETEATQNPFLDRELDDVIKQLSKIQNRLHTERVLKQISKQISKQED